MYFSTWNKEIKLLPNTSSHENVHYIEKFHETIDTGIKL